MKQEPDFILDQLDDIGIGFRAGAPYMGSPRRSLTVMRWATGVSVGSAAIVLLALIWCRFAA